MKFSEMNLDKDLVRVTEEMGFAEPTFIQEKSIPVIKEGKDIFAQSETGSGKTLAFAFPIIEKIISGKGVQCIIISPTRELAEQIAVEFKKFAKYRRIFIAAVYGGLSIGPQIDRIARSEVVIATPGRLLDHMSRGTINFSRVKFLVLDEADKMFEMGFIDDIKEIIRSLPEDRQTMLFSATISTQVRDIASHYMHNPVSVKANLYVDKALLEQHYYEVPTKQKFSLLAHLIKEVKPSLGMVFCGTRERTDAVARNLQKLGIEAIALHGGHSQNKRTSIMKDFHAGKIHMLIATDVAARGLDIKNVSHIFNFDIPKTSQEYVHRIGRTARAGKSGMALSLLAEADFENFRRVLEDRSLNIQRNDLPQFEQIPFLLRDRPNGGQRGNFRRGGGFGNPELRERRGNYHSSQDRGNSDRSSFDRRDGPRRPVSDGPRRPASDASRRPGRNDRFNDSNSPRKRYHERR